MTSDATDAPAADSRGFELATVWPSADATTAQAVRDFWRSEGALGQGMDMEQRLSQVVAVARANDGSVAGVSTAIALLVPRFGQPMYYYRAFVGKAWRTTTLVRLLINRSIADLEAFARPRGFPCIGVMLELENIGFNRALRMPVWYKPRFSYAGKSERGLEVRAYYFPGARLKSPEEVRALRLPAHV